VNQLICSKQPYIRHSLALFAGLFLSQLFFAPGAAQGQASPTSLQGMVELQMKDTESRHCDKRKRLLITVVKDDNAPLLDRQAVVKLHDLKRDITTWQTASEQSDVLFCSVELGDYEIDTSAVGFITDHRHWKFSGMVEDLEFKVQLHKDPTAVELSAADDSIPVNARKAAQHAVTALKSANLKEAKKQLDKAYQLAPNSAQVNFLYGYLLVQRSEFEKAEEFLTRATTIDPRREQALTLLGRVQLQLQHNEKARQTLERAISADAGQFWMAHYLLADACLRAKQYEKAQAQAEIAISEGKSAGTVAQLVRGQALADVGRNAEALQALNTFVETNPGNSTVPKVQDLIARLEKRVAEQGTNADIQPVADLALAASAPSLPESAWGPPGVDDVKPAVVAGVTCPSQQVIEATGERVKQLVDNIAKFAAIEDLVHEELDKTGSPTSKETRKFDYVASVTETSPGYLETEEYRNLRYGIADLPDHIVTSGFVTLALIFHPSMRDNFEMTCEGLGDWHGQATWLVHFRQRDDKPARFEDYTVGTQKYSLHLKGRAWISTDDLQIVRIESDLVSPLPQLAVQHQIAEYGPVPFPKKSLELWLPQNVDIFMELNKHRYHRRHSFDHYMLFSINSEDKSPGIKNVPASGAQTP
jgi:tetratricopeptide (TPR) repeat protein